MCEVCMLLFLLLLIWLDFLGLFLDCPVIPLPVSCLLFSVCGGCGWKDFSGVLEIFNDLMWFVRKLAKKRKDAIGNTRQEMTHMVNSMDRSYADQSTLHAEEPVSVTFMDSHNFSRCEYSNLSASQIIIYPSKRWRGNNMQQILPHQQMVLFRMIFFKLFQ